MLGDKHIHTYSEYKEQAQPKPERKVEDVPFEEVIDCFYYITPKCIKDNMLDHVEKTLRAACYGTAEDLWTCIHNYEKIGYLATTNEDASKIYRALESYFAKLKFTDRQFRKMRFGVPSGSAH